MAAERASEIATIHDIDLASPRNRVWTREEAIVELLRGRLALVGPTTSSALAESLGVDVAEADAALLKLESEGIVLRGSFESKTLEWCDRRLLARIHRYTLNRLRAEIEPVSAADFMRFLFAWQHATPSTRLTGIDGLRAVLAQLDGFEIAERAWERYVLPLRIDRYEEAQLDTLCLSGEVRWAQRGTGVVFGGGQALLPVPVSDRAQRVLDILRMKGPSFARDLDPEALEELTRATLITCDGFLGRGGRWSLLEPCEATVEQQAWMLLRRYGVVFRRLLTRETNLAPWRELARVYRRLEARGEIRGGRFVTGMSGEQFALPDAVERLREIRRTPPDGRMIVISAADPLNLAGILTAGDRIRALPPTRIAYRDGVALSVMEGDYLRPLAETSLEIAAALAGRRVPVAAGFVGR